MPDTRSPDRRNPRPRDRGEREDYYETGEYGDGYGGSESEMYEDHDERTRANLDTYYNDGRYANTRERESNRDLGDSGDPPFGMPKEVWDALDGGARAQYLVAQEEAERNRTILHNLADSMPTIDDLSVEYQGEGSSDEWGDLLGGPSALEGFGPNADQQASLDALRSLYESGGYTAADQNMSRALRDQQAMQLGAANRAAMQQMQARGMGGSGAELAMRMGAADSMAGANSAADAQLQQAAMMRALQSLQGWNSGSNTVQQQELARRSALDAFNQTNNDWRRGRESRNTVWGNQSRESRANAYRDQHKMRQDTAALHLGHNPNGSQSAGQAAADAQRGIVRDVLAGGAELVDGIFG